MRSDKTDLILKRALNAWPLWTLVGLASSAAIALGGSTLVTTKSMPWWYGQIIPAGHSGANLAVYLGMAGLGISWLAIGHMLLGTPNRLVLVWTVGALWIAPFVFAPALFSGDMYSYLAQGSILAHGLDPYKVAPIALGHLGQSHVLNAVAPVWRTTTAPYGPLFLMIVRGTIPASGGNLTTAIVFVRAGELPGIVLLATSVPRLSRILGTNPAAATWLAAFSPVVILELVAAGHNDALMVGLLVTGVTMAVDRHPLVGIAFCSVATAIKVPAVAGVALIALSWIWSEPTGRRRAKAAIEAALVVMVILGGISMASGLGLGWISSSVLSTPGIIHLAITPAVAIGRTISDLLALFSIHVASFGLETELMKVALGAFCVIAALIVWRTRQENLVNSLAWLLLASVLLGPALWLWYLTWSIALFATRQAVQKSLLLPVAIAASVFLIRPNGHFALALVYSPVVVAFSIAIAITYSITRHHRAPDETNAHLCKCRLNSQNPVDNGNRHHFVARFKPTNPPDPLAHTARTTKSSNQ